MPFNNREITKILAAVKIIVFIAVVLSSCYPVRKYQKGKPFVFKNSIEVKGGNFNKAERSSLKQRLYGQLDDSSKVTPNDFLFFWHIIKKPPAYDSGYAAVSAKNMKAAMMHQGYYGAKVSFRADTMQYGKQQRVSIHYLVEAGTPTTIDTVSYRLKKPELQELADQSRPKSYLIEGNPVTKGDILGEIGRLVELYRNNGYYKFTSDDLKMRGDTTIEALTTISDDPFENLRLLTEANEKKNKPTIKLAVVLNPVADSARLVKFHINNIYIYPDFTAADALGKSTYTEQKTKSGYTIRYHKKLFRTGFLLRNMQFKKEDIYRQDDYIKTINNFSKTGVWQSVNILVVENKDSVGKIDMIIQLIPGKKFAFEANIETSYAANNNNTTSGNLLGLSGNLSIQNRNLGKEAIKMTNSIKAGVELNLSAQKAKNTLINSNEVSYTNTIAIPRLITPFLKLNRKKLLSQQSFISTNLSYVKRIDLFSLQSVNLGLGYEWSNRPNRSWVLKPLNFEFSYLYNQSDSFKRTIYENPYLQYSFNTAMVMGSSLGYSSISVNPKRINHQRAFKGTLENSGFPLFIIPAGPLGLFKNYLRQFVKVDLDYTNTTSFNKSSFVWHTFLGVGIPIGKNETSLPFFKQYYGGGANSMRAWPIRGIGRGSQPLLPLSADTIKFNDRTGDIKLEGNLEYRYDILPIIPNSVTLKGALFIDAGNIWNFKNTRQDGGTDSLQFNFSRLYEQLGVDAGVGFRFDFNYFLIRFDLGFRFKRPELGKNDGWKAPSIGFDDALKKIFTRGENDEYRKWRYENFNFTVGLSYPF